MADIKIPQDLTLVQIIFFDFDGVFTDNRVWVCEDGLETVSCYRSDGVGLQRLMAHGVRCCIVSSETNRVVSVRANKLGIDCFQGVESKDSCVLEVCERYDLTVTAAMFVGNDINDIPALKLVGFPVVVADAYPEAKDCAIFETKRRGGRGAVREICDLVASVKV